MLISFKEWLDKESPPSPNIWTYDNNADLQYFTNLKSKYYLVNNKTGQSDFDPDELYFCPKKKKSKKKIGK